MNLKTKQSIHRVTDFLKECTNNLSLYPELKDDLKLLCTPEMKDYVSSKLAYILPGLLVLATSSEESVVHEIVPLYCVINDIVSKDITVKTEPWWREMESNIVPNKFFSGLTTLIENNSEFWSQTWIFAMSLMISDTQLQGSTVNSLLKIMEVAFKKSLTDSSGSIMDKAFFCWIRFIEIFTNNPRILHSKKLIGLLIRPLTIPMGKKSHLKIIETYKYLFEKVGKSEVNNLVLDIINPFIEYSYMKNEHSFSRIYPNECCELLVQLLSEKDSVNKAFILPVLSSYSNVVESKPSAELLLKLWSNLLDNSDLIDTNLYEQYLEHIITQREKVLKNNDVLKEYETLEEYLMKNKLPSITAELLDKLLTSSALSPKILADLMEYNDFRTKTLANYFSHFINNVNTEAEKREASTSSTGHMEAWDTFCAAFNLFLESKGYTFQETDTQTFKSLILFPLQTHAKWAGVTQRTWHSVIDSVNKIGILKVIIPDIILTINLNFDSNKVNISTVIDIITHLISIDKSAAITSTIDKILVKLPKDDPKHAIDLLAFIENLIGHSDKKQYLSGVLSELLRICTCYDQLYEHRIKTKVSKLHRKLIIDSKNDKIDKAKESKTPSPKIRSPLLSGSNFLHRLAKSEEKKAMSSISPPVIGDRSNVKGNLKMTKDLDINEGDIAKAELKEKDKASVANIKEEIVLPKSVNIVVTNNTLKTNNNVPILKTPENHAKLNGKLQNGDCHFANNEAKPGVTTKRKAISYFEDDTQEFVVVPSVPKRNTPLTEHQKEKMLQRKSDIPALYQDLSQDTQSISSILGKSSQEILTTPENDKKEKLNVPAVNIEPPEKLDISKESEEVIEVTPPCQDILTTPTKCSPHFTANKKLNFEGLVKASSPVCIEKHQHNSEINQNSITPTRRISHRKSTSRYSAQRLITPTKDLNTITCDEGSVANDGLLQAKKFIKQGVIVKKIEQNIGKTPERKDFSNSNEKPSSANETEIDDKNLCSKFAKTVQNEEKGIDNDVTIDFILSSDSEEVNDVKAKSVSDVKKHLEVPVTVTKGIIMEEDTIRGDTSKDKEISDVLKDVTYQKEGDECSSKKGQNSDSCLIEMTNETNIDAESSKTLKSQSLESPQKKMEFEIISIIEEKAVCKDDEVVNLNKSDIPPENSTPPSSHQKVRRPRKKPPSPFSPKLTRSKKLSLQNKDKSPKSPKDSTQKLRAPKPNTESFSSDSNDSLSGIKPLEKNDSKAVVVIEEKKIVHSTMSSDQTEDNLGKENKNVELNKVSDLNASLKDGEKNETSPEKIKLSESNDNIEPKRKGRKRKIPASPEVNIDKDTNRVEVKHVIASKRGRKKKGFGMTRLNSSSPKFSSGLEHWLYKKDKVSTGSLTEDLITTKMENKKSSDDNLKELSQSNVTINIADDNSSDEKIFSCDKNETYSKESESLEEMLLGGNTLNDCSQSIKVLRSCGDLDDTEILTSEESEIKASQNTDSLELAANDVENSNIEQYSEDIFSSESTKPDPQPIEINMPPSHEVEQRTTVTQTGIEAAVGNEVSPTVTKVEKISNGMKACDLIFKGAEVEEKITIYMEQRPFSGTNEVVVSPLRVEEMDTDVPYSSASNFSASTSDVETREELEKTSPSDNASSKVTSESSASFENKEKPDEGCYSSATTSVESDLLQMDTASLIELVEKDIALNTGVVQESLETSTREEKSSLSPVEKENVDELEVDMEVTDGVNIEVSKYSENEAEIEPKVTLSDNKGSEKTSVALSNEVQNDSEQLFKTDIPKKRGARFIHTTENEEDGGDTAEDRRKRNFRSRRVNMDDINSLGSRGRSKHMVQLAQQGRNSRVSTPRRRPNIVPIVYGANWPTGPTEDWVGIRPSTPAPCSSPSILKSSPTSTTPSTTPTNSTVSPPKKKRVNFLDPPVSTGLLYEKGSKVGIGQLHYAELSPGKKRPWIRNDESVEKKSKQIDNEEDQWQDVKEEIQQPLIEVEVLSSDESIEVLTSTDDKITSSENLMTNEKIKGIKTNTIGKLSTLEVQNEETTILESAISPVLEDSTNTVVEINDKINKDLVVCNINENKDDINIPTVEQLKVFFNNSNFIDNLALVINESGEQISWCQQFFNSLYESSKK